MQQGLEGQYLELYFVCILRSEAPEAVDGDSCLF